MPNESTLGPDELQGIAQAFQTDVNLAQAARHKDAGNAFGREGNLLAASDEFGKGIALLSVQMSVGKKPVLDLMVELRELRAAADQGFALQCLNNRAPPGQGETPAQIEARCRRIVDDATAVLELTKHASPVLIRKARFHRITATCFLNNSLHIHVSDRCKQNAVQDCRTIMADPDADDKSKAFAERSMQYLMKMVSSTDGLNQLKSIAPSFLTKDDLSRVPGLNVGITGQPRHTLAKAFMDKGGPVSMSDGTPKPLPPGVSSIDQITSLTPKQLDGTFGRGASTFLGRAYFGRDTVVCFWANTSGRPTASSMRIHHDSVNCGICAGCFHRKRMLWASITTCWPHRGRWVGTGTWMVNPSSLSNQMKQPLSAASAAAGCWFATVWSCMGATPKNDPSPATAVVCK